MLVVGGPLGVGATTQLFGPIALLRHHVVQKVDEKGCLKIKSFISFICFIIDLDAHIKDIVFKRNLKHKKVTPT